MADLDGDGIEDPWEPHWLDEPHPDDKAALQTTFAGIHPETLIPHDMPAEMSAGLGLPGSLVEQAMATAPVTQEAAAAAPPAQDPNGWNPAFTSEQPIEAPQMFAPATPQPGTGGLPQQLLDKAVESTEPGENLYADDPLHDPDEERGAAVVEDMAIHDPVRFAKLMADREYAKQNKFAADLARAAEEDRIAAEGNLKVRKDAEAVTAKKMAALDVQATELMARKVDPSRYMSSRSIGQRIIDLLGGAIGGYVATQTHGPNPYIAGLNQRIDQDIDAQKQEIENGKTGIGMKRSILGDEYSRTGDLYQSAEAVRIATKSAVRDKILADQQLYDPKGTQFIARGKAAAEMTAQIQAGQQSVAQKHLENEMKIGDHNLKVAAELRAQRKDEEDARHNKALEDAKAAAKKGAGGGVAPSRAMFAAKNKITTWGQDEERAYQATIGKVAGSISAGGGVGPSSAPGATAAQGAAVRTYKDKEDWFSANAPTASDVDKKRFWFVDGKNGNEVPPIEIESIEEPEKFGRRQRIRQQMGVKADQLRILTEKLQKRGMWDKAVSSKISWKNDGDVQEARSLAEDLAGDAIQAKEMGVPSGNDVERIKTMVGGDPAGWQDPTANLQRFRESMQIEQDKDWQTNAPAASSDGRYNKYRVLPTASPDWVKKFQYRGAVKEIGPEYGNTDPKQLEAKRIAGDAPNVELAKVDKETTANVAAADTYLKASGAGGDDRTTEAPQQADFKFRGPPDAGDAFTELRTHYVNNVALLNKYKASHDPKEWKAFQTGQAKAQKALVEVLAHSGRYYDANFIPKDKRSTWTRDPAFVARLTKKVLKSGGTANPDLHDDEYGREAHAITPDEQPKALKLKPTDRSVAGDD